MRRVPFIFFALGLLLWLGGCKTESDIPSISKETARACAILNRFEAPVNPRPLAVLDRIEKQIDDCDLALSQDRLAPPRAADLIFDRLDSARSVLAFERASHFQKTP